MRRRRLAIVADVVPTRTERVLCPETLAGGSGEQERRDAYAVVNENIMP
jgi:hypothetical protein